MKKVIHQLHLWLGLTSSLILFLICLSGTILTFHLEIEELLHPENYHLAPQTSHRPLQVDDLIHQIEINSKGKVSSFTIPSVKDRPYQFIVKKKPTDRRGRTLYINPYNSEILNNPDSMPEWFFFFFRMHRWLLLDPEIGRPIVGVATIIFTFLLLSGLYLWWPQNQVHLKNSLRIRFKGNWKRVNYDLHNSLGFYSLGILLVMSLTGLFWSFEWYRNLGSAVLQTKVFDRESKPLEVPSYGTKLPISNVLNMLPPGGKTTVVLPQSDGFALTVFKYNEGMFTIASSDKFELDPYSGKVLKHQKFSDKPLGQKMASLIKPLHTGEFMGIVSKIIYFIACLIGTSLPISGFFIWFNKKKAVS